MKPHVKIYIDFFDCPIYVGCENCGKPCDDIHHIEPKGMGGSKKQDYIENLIALCRSCHNRAHGIELPRLEKNYLKKIHNREIQKVKHDRFIEMDADARGGGE